MDVFIRVAFFLTVQRTLLAARHRPMETSSLQIKLVYFFSKYSSLQNVYLFFILTSSLMFPWCRGFPSSRSLPCGIAFDCGRLLEITASLPKHHWKFSLYIYKL